MQTVVEMEFGSRVYGTAVPESDRDVKFLFQPDAKNIVLGNAPKQISTSTKKNSNEKNSADDIDREGFSLPTFFQHLTDGQTFALDMLFTPECHWTTTSPTWEVIVTNRDKLVSKRVSAFVGYCRAQFSKYCVKAERLAAVEAVVNLLSQFPPRVKIKDVAETQIRELALAHPGIVYWRDGLYPSLECCGRQVQVGADVKRGLEIFQRVLESYGDRTRRALDRNAIDWKALYHAVRVAREAEELLLTGKITFPRPEADLLLEIRKAQMSYDEVSNLIEDGLLRVESALVKSPLPESPDHEWMESLVIERNICSIINHYCLLGRAA